MNNPTKLWWQTRIKEQQAEIRRLRALNMKLMEACEAMVASQEVIDLDERESREGLAFERIEDALKATSPEPKT